MGIRSLRRTTNPQPDVEARYASFVGPVSSSLFGESPYAGVTVDIETALRNAAFAACRRVLMTEVAQLPVHTYTKRGGGRRRVADPLAVSKPSATVSQRTWVAQVMDSLVRAGNAYGVATTKPGTTEVIGIDTVDPSVIRWSTVDGVLRPHMNGKAQHLWPYGDFVHIPASAFITAGNPVALCPVDMAKESISTGLAAEKYGAEFFGGGGHPTTAIYTDQELDPTQAARIKAAFVAATVGRAPVVLGSALSMESVQTSVADSQFVAVLQFQVEQMCRFMGVPPSMVYANMSGQSVEYANVTDNDMQFLKHGLGIWLADVEDAWSQFLVNGTFVKFNTDALLRMDAEKRATVNKIRLESKTMTVNEVREREDEEPFEDPAYDLPGIPALQAPAQLSLPLGDTDV